jgi:tetratricopeptide (TPR) repeat protein
MNKIIIHILLLCVFIITGCASQKPSLFEPEPKVPDSKIEAMADQLKQNPSDISLRIKLTIAYIYNRDFDNAKNTLSKIVIENENDTTANYLMGLILMRQGFLQEAKKYYDKVLKIKPNDKDTLFNLAGVELSKGNYTSAEALYLRVLEIDPEDGDAHYDIAVLYDKKLFELKKALYHYNKCVKIYKNKGIKIKLVNAIRDRISELEQIEKGS